MRAGYEIGSSRRVNLLKYVSWLIAERDARRMKIKNRSYMVGSVSLNSVLALLKQQKYQCALTGRVLNPGVAALDHMIPICRNGEHRIENAQVLHKDVNRAKATLTNEEFVQLCREVVQWAASKMLAE